MYGAQTLALTNNKLNIDKIAKIQQAIERQILNITLEYRKRNTWIKQITNVGIDITKHLWNGAFVDTQWDNKAGTRNCKFDDRWPKSEIEEDHSYDIKRSPGLAWRLIGRKRREAFVQYWTNEG